MSLTQLERNRLSWKKYRENNREIIRIKSRERMRVKREVNPEKLLEYNRQYRKNNPDKTKEWDRMSYYKNREQKLKQKKEYWIENKDKIKSYYKKWRGKNKENVLKKGRESNKKYYRKNRDNILEKTKKYGELHPEIRLKSMKNLLSKIGDWYNSKEHPTYMAAFISWSKTIKKRDNNRCQICGEKAEISHHVLFKAKFPELSLNENNGISLCKKHHKEIHTLNGI